MGSNPTASAKILSSYAPSDLKKPSVPGSSELIRVSPNPRASDSDRFGVWYKAWENIGMRKLSVTGVKAAKRAGFFGDGDGLFLVVGSTGFKTGCATFRSMAADATSDWVAHRK